MRHISRKFVLWCSIHLHHIKYNLLNERKLMDNPKCVAHITYQPQCYNSKLVPVERESFKPIAKFIHLVFCPQDNFPYEKYDNPKERTNFGRWTICR